MENFLIYIFQVSVCHFGSYLLYKLVFKKSTFFQLNRVYLLASLIISFIIPLLNIGVYTPDLTESIYLNDITRFTEQQLADAPVFSLLENESNNVNFSLIYYLWIIYVSGCLFFLLKFARGLYEIGSLIRKSIVLNVGSYKLIHPTSGPSFYSFLSYVFINKDTQELTNEELNSIIEHEKVHINQFHSIDNMLVEFIGILCWVSPFIKRFKMAIRQTHEFIADSHVIEHSDNKQDYANLILKLVSNYNPVGFTNQFSLINTKQRIIMLHKSKLRPMTSLKYLTAIPLLISLMFLFSFTDKALVNNSETSFEAKSISKLIIGEIAWEGNKKYNNLILSNVLGIKTGDVYTEEILAHKQSFDPQKRGISDLYMDNGYLFFNMKIEANVIENKVDLHTVIYEGSEVIIDKIIIEGQNDVDLTEIMKIITLRKGDLFSRSKVIESQKNLAASGFFDPDSIRINPIPHDGRQVDIKFELVEI